MENKPKEKEVINIDVKSLSHTNLVGVIQKLRGSEYPELLQMAQKELVDRLKQKGVNHQCLRNSKKEGNCGRMGECIRGYEKGVFKTYREEIADFRIFGEIVFSFSSVLSKTSSNRLAGSTITSS